MMDVEFVINEKDVLEIMFSEKELGQAMVSILNDMGSDAYTYTPHPLQNDFRLHIESKNPLGDFNKALKKLDAQWTELSKLLTAKLK